MNAPTDAPERLRTCRRVAIEDGLEAALSALAALLPTNSIVGHGGRVLAPADLLDRLDDAVIVAEHRTDAGALALAETGTGGIDTDWCLGVAWIRIGAIERLNRRATARLARRRIRGGPTIGLTLVRATVGDVATSLACAVAALEAGGDEQFGALIEREIDTALHATWRLFGASGYVLDDPANLAQATALLADVYTLDTGAAS